MSARQALLHGGSNDVLIGLFVTDFARLRDLSLREAATVLAVQRVAEAHRLRGLYP